MTSRLTLPARFTGGIAILLSLALGGCGKSSGSKSTSPVAGTGTVQGQVVLAGSNTAVAGATVSSTGGGATVSSTGGQFTISVPAGQDVRLDVTKAGYSLNQVHVTLAKSDTKTLSVGLLAAGNTASVAVASGGSVTDPSSNAKITLPANFVTATGPVTVTVTGLDPTTDQIQALPGGLTAVDAGGNVKYLKPVSFAEYTVKDATGKTLQFNSAASSGANIELPIPASLQGQPGYGNGDPIECYVYDPGDGKWKTPVPGVIGPSTVNGQPAIKATIFHLSWYGGAPASSDIGCVHGTVRDSLGHPVAGISVQAWPGTTTTTDVNGAYQLSAAAKSAVRVVASRLVNGVFEASADTVLTGGSADPCVQADFVLHSQQAQFQVLGYIGAIDVEGNSTPYAQAIVTYGVAGEGAPLGGAIVKVGSGTTWTTLNEIAPNSGTYEATGGPGGDSPSLTLDPGQSYTLQLDFDHNGSVDATGDVRMVGNVAITSPDSGAVEPKSFTATWTDDGSGVSGYLPYYFGANAAQDSAAASSSFLTTARSKVIGSGIADPQTGAADPPLTAGDYDMFLITLEGPFAGAGVAPNVPTSPNISGANASGWFFSYGISSDVPYTSTGTSAFAASRVAAHRAGAHLTTAEIAAIVDRRIHLRLPMSRMLESSARGVRRANRGASHSLAGRFGR